MRMIVKKKKKVLVACEPTEHCQADRTSSLHVPEEPSPKGEVQDPEIYKACLFYRTVNESR